MNYRSESDAASQKPDALKDRNVSKDREMDLLPSGLFQKSNRKSISEKSNFEYNLPRPISEFSNLENRLIIREGSHDRKSNLEKSASDQKPFGLRDNCRLTRLKGQIAESENILSCARKIGMNVTSLELTSRKINDSCNQGNIKAVQDQIHLLKSQMRESFSDQIPRMIKKIRKDIKEIEDCGRDVDIPKTLVSKANAAYKKEIYFDALSLLAASRKKIVDIHYEMVIEIISDAKRSFILADKIGLSKESSIALLNASREMLRLGQINDAIRFAEESREMINRKLNEYRASINLMMSCVQSLKIAHLMGIDLSNFSPMLTESKNLLQKNEYLNSARNSKNIIALTKKAIQERTLASISTAERALELSKKSGSKMSHAENLLQNARNLAKKENYLKSFLSANSSLYESNSTLIIELENKSRAFNELTNEISEEMENLSKTQDAILHSKGKSLDEIREYSNIYEKLINQAYDSAISYTHVSKDIVTQAVKKSIEKSLANSPLLNIKDQNDHKIEYIHPECLVESNSAGEKRLEIVQLYLKGKISGEELDKLLSEIDCDLARANLI